MTIKANGQSTVYVKPDRYRVVLSIFTRDKSLVDCGARNDKAVAELEKVFQKFKVPSDSVQKTDLLFDRSYSYGFSTLFSSGSSGSGSEGKGKFLGYEVNRRLAVVLDNESQVRNLIEDATSVSDVSLHAVAFEAADLEKLKLAARLQALENCKNQAAALAGQLSMGLGKPVFIDESNVFVRYLSDMPKQDAPRALRNAAEMSANYEIGKLAISADVAGTFELTDKQ